MNTSKMSITEKLIKSYYLSTASQWCENVELGECIMRSKIKRIVIILNVIINFILGISIFLISNLMYRYERMGIWIEQNILFNQFYIELHDLISFAWIIWGALCFLSILLLISELRKSS